MVVRVEKETAKTKKVKRSKGQKPKKVDCDTMLVKTGSGAR
jgi:hypothetical protein